MAYQGTFQKGRNSGTPPRQNKPQNDAFDGGQKPKKKKSKVLLIVLLVIVLLLALLVGGGVWYYNDMLSRISRPDDTPGGMNDEEIAAMYGTFGTDEEEETTVETTAAPTTEPYSDGNYGTTGKVVNILLVGQDSREDEQHKNTDTIILASINKETKVVTLSSFLRDSYIKLANYKTHTCGKSKLTFAYALGFQWGGDQGAMDMLDNTLINNYGVTIDNNVEINLESFVQIIDTLGGIDVELDEDEYNYMCNDNKLWDLPGEVLATMHVGECHLNGTQALSYARMRHSSGTDNDFKRTARQRNVVAQVVEKLKTMSLTELNKLVQDLMPMILTDMSNAQITTYMMELLPILPYVKIESQQIPLQGTYSGKLVDIFGDGTQHSVQDVWDLKTNRANLEAVCSGNPIPEQ